jgi:hypothetical protein
VTLQNGDLVTSAYDTPNCAQTGGYAALLWDLNRATSLLYADSASFGQPASEQGAMVLMCTGLLGLFRTVRRCWF